MFTPSTSVILVVHVSHTPTTAPINSSLGMLVAMFGEAPVFAATMFVEKVPSLF